MNCSHSLPRARQRSPWRRSAVGCGQDVASGAVGGVPWTFVCFLPCPCVLWAPQQLPGSGAAGEVHLLSALLTTLAEKVLKDPSGHRRFAALEAWCCSTLYPFPKVFLLVPLCTWKCRSTCPSMTPLCFVFGYSLCDVLSPKMAFLSSMSALGVPLSITGYFRALKVVLVLCVNIWVTVSYIVSVYGMDLLAVVPAPGNFTRGQR